MIARGQATRLRILAAARELLAERGAAAAVRLDDIVARAGTTKATLYRYFPSKAILIGAVAPELAGRTDTESRRAQILDAALTVVARHGVHGTTMERVADEAGVSAATLYLYVRSKDELIVALAERLTSRAMPLLAAQSADVAFAEVLLHMAPQLVEVQGEHVQTLSVLLGEVATRPELAAALYERVLEPLWAVFGTHLEREVHRGSFRPGHPILRVLAFVGMLTFYNLARRAFGDRVVVPPPAEAARELVQIFLHGVAATPEGGT